MIDLALSDEVDPAFDDILRDNFRAHAAEHGVPSDFRPLTVKLLQDGRTPGGLSGRTGRGWLYVERLSLPAALRGQGFGRRLMALAEDEAVRRGCTGAWLNTIRFQAPLLRKAGLQRVRHPRRPGQSGA